MDAQKRQKVLLIVVSVLALGAGSYWFIGRDSGGGKSAAMTEGPVVKKERAAKAEVSVKKKRDVKSTTRDEPATVERKERDAPEETTVEKKKRREDRTKEKKKVVAPAA